MSQTTGKSTVLRSQAGVFVPASLSSLMRSLAESLIDKVIETRCIGGVYGNQRPTEFLCLLLKLLQIQPEKEILVEYLRAEEFKCVHGNYLSIVAHLDNRYLRALAALYIRMTFRAVDVYELLEPLLKDYRKLRLRNMGASTHATIFFIILTHYNSGLFTDVHGRICRFSLDRGKGL